ncbi:hypothetical protein CEUSTIGMA_g11721.t1 [Chlamydomonas eustigma]|uniref:Gamma-glutamyltransferase n=1 Tax=Chlamydomonas eustigma TaxID=1157962 RepID=A0A250XMY7_9CHLO|nr:hypothetical protein CEUSTIGMA_g11721.t1 [Chlamydomonas eustigma]|eukprot:GAX84299.1 hypothetical protein CEUSTIGMA_g11721.t1 [Chlamydomonas eustigma]
MLYTIIRKNDLEDLQLSGNDGVTENHKNTKNAHSVALRVGCSVVVLFVVTAACTMLIMGGNHLTSSEVKLSSTCKTAFDCDFSGRPRKIQTKGGLVVADHGVCSEIGAQALDDGGHAVDAAVATAICQGVINSFASGLGGGDFLMIREANGSSLFINAREQAASAATADMYVGKDSYAALDGGLAVAIPLQLKGLELAWSRYGKLPWSSLVVPSIKLAEDGFRMHPYLHYILSGPFTLRRIQNNTLLREVYLIHETDGSWRIPNVGEWCCRKPTLARSLRRISKLGAAWLYSPRQSKLMAAEIQSSGGILTETDLRSSFPTVHRPMSKKIGDFEFIFPPPPSSGAAVVLAMDILAGFPNTTSRMLTQHWLVESMKHIYAVRTSMGDPGTPEHPFRNMSELLSDMMDSEFSKRLRESVHDDRVLDASEYGGQWNPECLGGSLDVKEDHGTSHMSIVDAEGNAVSMTMTINTAFGSAVVSESTGIIFNNEMDDFNTKGPTGSHLLPGGSITCGDRS